MRNLDKYFENKNIEYDKLLEYGFILNNNNYIFDKNINNNNFKVVVEISQTKKTSKVLDLSINNEYLLVDIKDSVGNFVGKLKEEYENILNDIIKKCTTPNIFKSTQAKKIIKYIKEKYNDELEYLWKKFPNNAIWRNKNNNKWYGALLEIPESKLGIESDKIIEIIDLRYQKDKIKEIVDKQKVFTGYHMNKNSWITIKLDGSVKIEKIFTLIDNSYNISLNKKY